MGQCILKLNVVRLGSYCEVNNTKEKCKTVHTVFLLHNYMHYLIYPRLFWNFLSSQVWRWTSNPPAYFWRARITNLDHLDQFMLRTEPRASHKLCKHSAYWAKFPAHVCIFKNSTNYIEKNKRCLNLMLPKSSLSIPKSPALCRGDAVSSVDWTPLSVFLDEI